MIPSKEALSAALGWSGPKARDGKRMWAVGEVPSAFSHFDVLGKSCGALMLQGHSEHLRDKSCHCHPVATWIIACSTKLH